MSAIRHFTLAAVIAVLNAQPAGAVVKPSLLGAWQRSDGRLFTLAPSADDTWRFRMLDDGSSGRLHAAGKARWEAGAGFSDRRPVAVSIQQLSPVNLLWTTADGAKWEAARVPLREQDMLVEVDGVKLAARLVLPAGPGPFPVVVFVHGSERLPAVGHWHDPYMMAAHGIAGAVYDKRGTGRSGGEFTADFVRLAKDAAAVANSAQQQPGIASDLMGFAGYSQGGWVVPLAAEHHGATRAVSIGYGSIDSPLHEDRWQCREALRDILGDDADARAILDEWVDVTHALLRSNLQDGWDAYKAQGRRIKSVPWVARIDGERCIAAGFAGYPAWVLRGFAGKRLPPQINWDHDSHAVLGRFEIPTLWQLAGDDREAPSADTAKAVQALQGAGKPHQLHVYPLTDHGILRYRAQAGERVPLGYHPDYYRDLVAF